MTREDTINTYHLQQMQSDLKEYVFMTRSGYRHFFILGKNLREAEENFMRIDEIKRNGFTLKDLPIRLEYDKEKCENWSMDSFWSNNENTEVPIISIP